ncbi:MAG: diaminopimelate decarboxylase [Armatimonadetes bacterium]|nr:diaminopimelate decarboxylase [Armatimonadota bacterium]
MFLGTQRVNALGRLEIGGCDTLDLAARFGTPLYVMDEALIRSNCCQYRRAFESRLPGSVLAYAGKAFLCLAMCKIMEEEGFWLDVASAGELYTAAKADFPAGRIMMHGNNKSEEELVMALDYGVARIVVDNAWELGILDRMTQERGQTADILLRTTPGIDPHTHKRIRTGQADTKFGLNIHNGAALAAVRQALDCPNIRLKGFHFHIGSQLLDAHTHHEAVRILVDFMREAAGETGYQAEDLNIGGGLGIRYLESHCPPSIDEFSEEIIATLQKALAHRKLKPPRLMQEPGRSIVGEAGTTLYTVGTIKTVPIKEEPGQRTYVAIDGGMSDNPRPQLYEARYEALIAGKAGQEPSELVTVAGKHCETDILIWDIRIQPVRPGDILAVQSTGAYNYAMASNYNRFRRPAAVLVKDGQAEIIIRRESYDDLLLQDGVPERLAGKP